MENKYKRIVAIDTDTGEIIGNTFIGKGEEVVLSTKKKLSDNQKNYLKKRLSNRKKFLHKTILLLI